MCKAVNFPLVFKYSIRGVLKARLRSYKAQKPIYVKKNNYLTIFVNLLLI